MTQICDRTSYVSCDVCKNQYCFTRYVCLTCLLEDYTNHVDICAKCLGHTEVVKTDDFVHDPWHTLFKSRTRILKIEKAYQISNARARSKRIKDAFRGDGGQHHMKTEHGKAAGAEKETPVFNCAGCEKVVNLPCWACTTCCKPCVQSVR